VKEGVAV